MWPSSLQLKQVIGGLPFPPPRPPPRPKPPPLPPRFPLLFHDGVLFQSVDEAWLGVPVEVPVITVSQSSSMGAADGWDEAGFVDGPSPQSSSVDPPAGKFDTGTEATTGLPSPQSSSVSVGTLGVAAGVVDAAVDGVSQSSSATTTCGCDCCCCVKDPRFENPPRPPPRPRPPTEK